MRHAFSRWRRFAIVFLALGASSLLFRTQVAQALVVRGDDFMYRGNVRAATLRYARAVLLDPDLSVAADRYIFVSMQRHTTPALRTAISVANAFLTRHPYDPAVLTDRAMCYLREHRNERARGDFELAAAASSQPIYYVYAGLAALHAGDTRGARELWRHALKIDAALRPAIVALGAHDK